MKQIFPKGSLWRKCDLHVHTPLDHEWISKPDISTPEKREEFAKEFVDFAISEGIELIAVTDHNFCNNPEELILKDIITEAHDKPLTILPGFELTVKDGSGIHILIIFKENTPLTEIHEVVKRLFPLGTVLMPTSGIVPVCENELDDVKLILDSSKLDYILIFAHADRDNGVLDKKTISGTRRVQEWQKKYVNICQLSKAISEFGTTGFMASVINKTDPNYSRDITYITSSDCRTISKTTTEEGRHYLGQKFTWIKGNPTFEGLKQIIFEPLSRVRIQEDKPEQKRPHLYIDKVRFISDEADLSFQDNYVELNPNLNSIIGGKSSGKSLLLYYIAKTIDPKQVSEKYDEIAGDGLYSFEKDIPNFNFEVVWADEANYKLLDPELSKNRQITFIPQLYINHLAEKRGNDELKRLIQSILEEKKEFLEFYNKAKENISRFKGATAKNVFEYFEQKQKISDIGDQIKSKGDKAARSLNLKTRRDELAKLRAESGFSEEEEANYLFLLSNLTIHENRKLNFETLLDILKNEYLLELGRIQEGVSKALDKIQDETQAKFTNSETFTKIYLNQTDKFKNEILSPFSSVKEKIEKRHLQIEKFIEYSINKIIKYQDALKPHLEKITKKEKLSEIQADITSEETALNQIEELENQEKLLEKQRKTYKEEIIKNYTSMMFQYQSIVSEVNLHYNQINPEKEIILKAILSFDTERFSESCSKYITKYSSFSSTFGSYFNINEFVFKETTHLEDLKDFFEKLLNKNIPFNKGGSQGLVCEKMFDDYFFIDFEIFQKEESIFKMSPGKKGLILLYLILHLSNASYPILIDQPEDNLDNRTVYRELKDFIKEKKIERQIIIVTHNANIVVPTDSENVIVANQSGQDKGKENEKFRFEYISGALEDKFINNLASGVLNQMGIRDHVCEILEGGEIAFKEREMRYSII